MKLDNNINISPASLKKLGTLAGVISVIIVGYYATGLYRNIIQIKKLNKEDSKPLTEAEK